MGVRGLRGLRNGAGVSHESQEGPCNLSLDFTWKVYIIKGVTCSDWFFTKIYWLQSGEWIAGEQRRG